MKKVLTSIIIPIHKGRKTMAYIGALLAVVIISSCNSELFIDDIDLPDVSDVTIEGDGGEWSTAFSRKGLSRIRIDYSSHDKEYVRYFSVEGPEVDADCPASELGSIVYENPKTFYSIGFVGEMMYLTSHYNASDYDMFTIYMDYDYGVTKSINVTLTEGEKLQLVTWIPTGNMRIEENISKSVTYTTSLTNNSSLTQKLETYPLLDSRCSDMVMPSEYWANGIVVDLPIPTFNGIDWEWREYKDVRLGERRDFSPNQSLNHKISVEVPAYSKAKISYTLNYSRATQEGFISLSNPVDDRSCETPVTWTSVYATSYEYAVEYE